MRSPLITLFLALTLACISSAQSHWIGTWGASPSPQLPEAAKTVPSQTTIREIVHVSAGGSLIRVRLSNAYGKEAVQISAAHVALHDHGAAIVPGTDHALTFSSQTSISIPPNALVLSDPVSLNVAPGADLAISLFLPDSGLAAGIHYAAQQTNYWAHGDLTAAADLPGAATFNWWEFLTGIDVEAPASAATIIAFGDSITDGAHSSENANHRWPNYLADRLLAQGNEPILGVLDEGIGGNRILHDPNSNIGFGVNALARFDRDVLAQPGVKYVIVLEGINDLGHAGPDHFPNEQVSARDIIDGLKQLIARAHEKGLKVYGGTLTPFAGVPPGYFSEKKEIERKAVNEWIRTSHAFDAVVDFDKAVQDPDHPDRFAPDYDSGDHLHPKDAGYKAMAEAIDLSLFK